MTEEELEMLDQFMALFPSAEDHGRLDGWVKDEAGKVIVDPEKGTPGKNQWTAKRPAGKGDFQRHLTSRQDEPVGIGCYGLHTDGLMRFGVVDLDVSGPAADAAILDAARLAIECGCHPYLERSVRDRWHLWLFPEGGALPGEKYLLALRALAQQVGRHKMPMETYPATFNPKRRGGKYVNLPYRGALSQGDLYLFGTTFLLDPISKTQHDPFGEPVLLCDLTEVRRCDSFAVGRLASKYQAPPKPKPIEMRPGLRESGELFDRAIHGLSQFNDKGARHEAMMAGAGVAAMTGVDPATAERELKAVAVPWAEAGRKWDEEIERGVKSTFAAYAKGEPITGLSTLLRLGVPVELK